MKSVLPILFLFASLPAFSQQLNKPGETQVADPHGKNLHLFRWDVPRNVPEKKFRGTTCYSFKSSGNPIILVDGKRKRRVSRKMKSEDVVNIQVIKVKEATKRFGKSGKYGAVIITTNKSKKRHQS